VIMKTICTEPQGYEATIIYKWDGEKFILSNPY